MSTYRIIIDGREVQLSPSECLAHTQGEFGGNLDFDIQFSHPVEKKTALACLRLRVPEESEPLDTMGYQALDMGMSFSMHSPAAAESGRVPAKVELLWVDQGNEQVLGQLAVREAPTDSEEGLAHQPQAGGGCAAFLLIGFAILPLLLRFL